jgi:hypothetical protein
MFMSPRRIREIADETVIEIQKRTLASDDNPLMASQVIAHQIGAVLTAERHYFAELIDDIPTVEQLCEKVDAVDLCNLIIDKLADLNRDQMIMFADEVVDPDTENVLLLTPDLMMDDLLVGSDEDLISSFAQQEGKHLSQIGLQNDNALMVIDAAVRVRTSGQPQKISFVEPCRGELRRYVVRLQWNAKKDKIVCHFHYRIASQLFETAARKAS